MTAPLHGGVAGRGRDQPVSRLLAYHAAPPRASAAGPAARSSRDSRVTPEAGRNAPVSGNSGRDGAAPGEGVPGAGVAVGVGSGVTRSSCSRCLASPFTAWARRRSGPHFRLKGGGGNRRKSGRAERRSSRCQGWWRGTWHRHRRDRNPFRESCVPAFYKYSKGGPAFGPAPVG